MTTLHPDQLVTVAGGDFKGATFGALALANALSGDPSGSVAKAYEQPRILRIAPTQSAGGGNWPPFPSYGGTVSARFGYGLE
jgi:hypothetical protein